MDKTCERCGATLMGAEMRGGVCNECLSDKEPCSVCGTRAWGCLNTYGDRKVCGVCMHDPLVVRLAEIHRDSREWSGATPRPCAQCGRPRHKLYNAGSPDYPHWICGTCQHREARRINAKEMHGHGRRGY